MAKRDFVAWTYTDDNGVDYTRRADAFFTSQVVAAPAQSVGGAAASGATLLREMPRNLKPRAVFAYDAGAALGAWVVIYDPAKYTAITTGTSTIDFRDASGASHTGVVLEKRGERPRGTIRP